ncbi:hypothetical protein HC251_00765 [Iamia sp. SCSIO 61187]|uniref:hypothetical protein n=1 Tax=Iamia sp. SCSIO 61187 TaxID=2722752 RepID=UPI001C63AD82|nr:hypothetical protein [Iamia sp. SCSIO 61187]QYG91106.1 hypothetical protein HC251_00765 [Iamia sp. SCSIO 61187]
MSGLDGLELDADGFVDMDQFPDDGSDLVGADLEQLRAALHADPVDEPTPEQWDAIVDDVVGLDLDAGPFAVDDPDPLLPDPAEDGTDDAAPDDLDDVDPDGDEPGEADAGADDADGVAEVDDDVDLDGLDDVDVDLDLDGGLDLMTADDAGDDPFDAAADGADDAAADVGPDFEDLL